MKFLFFMNRTNYLAFSSYQTNHYFYDCSVRYSVCTDGGCLESEFSELFKTGKTILWRMKKTTHCNKIPNKIWTTINSNSKWNCCVYTFNSSIIHSLQFNHCNRWLNSFVYISDTNQIFIISNLKHSLLRCLRGFYMSFISGIGYLLIYS